MRNEPLGQAARDSSTEDLRGAAPYAFRIISFQRVAYGSKVGEFSIETLVGVIECDVFEPPGREPFVQARSVRDKFTGQWRRTVALDRDFAARVLDALRARSAETKRERAEGRGASETLLASENRLNRAIDALDETSAS